MGSLGPCTGIGCEGKACAASTSASTEQVLQAPSHCHRYEYYFHCCFITFQCLLTTYGVRHGAISNGAGAFGRTLRCCSVGAATLSTWGVSSETSARPRDCCCSARTSCKPRPALRASMLNSFCSALIKIWRLKVRLFTEYDDQLLQAAVASEVSQSRRGFWGTCTQRALFLDVEIRPDLIRHVEEES